MMTGNDLSVVRRFRGFAVEKIMVCGFVGGKTTEMDWSVQIVNVLDKEYAWRRPVAFELTYYLLCCHTLFLAHVLGDRRSSLVSG